MRIIMNFKILLVVCLLLSLFIVSCAEEDDSDDGNSDADDDDNDDSSDDDDNDSGDDDDDDGWDNLSDELGEGEVRAGQISAENELIGGPRAKGEIGDYKIYNSKIELIIRNPEHPGTSLSSYSGALVDADRARPAEEAGADCLIGVENVIGLIRAFWAQEIELIEDGHNGAAIIRVTGEDGGISFVDSFLKTVDMPFTLINDYILEPDKDYVTIRTTVVNQTNVARPVVIVDMPFWRGATDTFTPRNGFSVGDVDVISNFRWAAGVNRIGLPVSYAFATIAPNKRLYTPYIYNDVLALVEGTINLPADGEVSYERIFIVGDGDVSMFPKIINEFDNSQEFGTIEGQVSSAKTGDLDAVKIIVKDKFRQEGHNFVAVLYPDENNKFSVDVNPGNYKVTVVGEGRSDSAPESVAVAAGETKTVALTAEAPGYLEIDITDSLGAALPCKISLQNGHDADPNAGPAHRFWSVTGLETFRVLPGSYTATVSRGYEYEVYQENIVILAGNTKTLTGSIEHSVDSTGLMSGDFHIHSVYSLDSHELGTDRIRHMVGEGLEMPVITDHDVQVDLMPFVKELNAQQWVQVVLGSEISPMIGHLNAWPLIHPEDEADYYSVPYMLYDETQTAERHLEQPEMWAILRADYGAQIIQMNHPRSTGGGYFSYLGYDPALGVNVLDPFEWSAAFDAIEVFNGSENSNGALEDWFSFLDQGLVYTMHGNSDSHTSYSELGNPRNVFSMPTDSPAAADVNDMITSQLAQRSQVSSGPLITFTIESESIGGFVVNHGSNDVDLNITIQAPSWVDVDYVKVFSNHGVEIFDDIVAPSSNVVRYDETVSLSVSEDSYFVVKTGHTSGRLGPVNPGMTIFAMTNPIWVDVDGNGAFNEPGLPVIAAE